jgi:DNA-binding NarL/FixJ family response regulator
VGSAPCQRLLIVEDHRLLATTLRLALDARGLEVETTAGPTAAAVLERVRALAPVLVMLDLDLGVQLGSGLDLIGPVIAEGGQVVMLTGVEDRSLLAACVEKGAVGIVSKASDFGDLVDTIGRAFVGEKLLTTREREDLLAELRRQRGADRVRLAPFDRLSPREQAALSDLMSGATAEAIAVRNYVSLATVRSQIRSVLLKLGVKSQLAAVAIAQRAEWSPSPG